MSKTYSKTTWFFQFQLKIFPRKLSQWHPPGMPMLVETGNTAAACELIQQIHLGDWSKHHANLMGFDGDIFVALNLG